MAQQIGRNSACPCGGGRKYKNCCLGKVSWEEILADGSRTHRYRNLSLRGKNIELLNGVCDILHVDKAPDYMDFQKAKDSVTPEVVRRIHELIVALWPDEADLKRVLRREAENSSGLYFGTYELPTLFRGITRHSLYSERILLPDPFVYPLAVREEFSPLAHPEEHRVNTLRSIQLWFFLAPWIAAGIVGITRLPGDFDPALTSECIRREKDRFGHDSELHALLDEMVTTEVQKTGPLDRGAGEYFLLSHPNEFWTDSWHKRHPEATEEEVRRFLQWIESRRAAHPYYIDLQHAGQRQILHWTSGTNYEMAKVTVMMSGSHLITDMPHRWREIELDRARDSIDPRGWNPFAKAFHNLEFKFLNDVPLKFAFRLRKERRLSQLRLFLRGIWNKSSTEDKYDERNVEALAAELNEKVREAKEEWRKIDRDLIKWFGTLGTVAASASAVSSGGIGWMPAAIGTIAGGITSLLVAQHQRAGFRERYPAAMFLDLGGN
jgi:hypothetical protein